VRRKLMGDQSRLAHWGLDPADQLASFRINILGKVDGIAESPNVLQISIQLIRYKHEAALVQITNPVDLGLLKQELRRLSAAPI
jgi:hypothetical protein